MITLNLLPSASAPALEPSISTFTPGYRQALNALRLIGRIAQLRALDKRRAALPSIISQHVHIPIEVQVLSSAHVYLTDLDPIPRPPCTRPRPSIIRRRRKSIG